MRRPLLLLLCLCSVSTAFATEIEGVQPAALDQPRVNACVERDPHGKALVAGKGGEQTINFQAFLDTGASGVLLSQQTADALGVQREKTPKGNPVLFQDVGVGGGDTFQVSEPLYVALAPFGRNEPDDESGYPISLGPVRTQIAMGGGLIAMITGGLDVVGMPAMKGKVAVIDPKPVDTFADTMRAEVVDKAHARDAKMPIPQTDRHIRLTYVSFQRFTKVTPPTMEGPALTGNPLVGPDPTAKQSAASAVPPVVATMNGKQSSGSWLLDTGAAASMISKQQAQKLGVTYAAGTEGTNDPKLAGVPADQQFSMTVGGVGGQKKSAGFFLDTLVVPTRERDPLVYKKAPVLVADITVEDPQTKQHVTLDGVLGINYFVASAYVSEAGGMLPDIGKMSAGPYDWLVFDEPAAELGVKLKKELLGGAGAGTGAGAANGNGSHGAGTIDIRPSKKRDAVKR
jgi:hypothetical protein